MEIKDLVGQSGTCFQQNCDQSSVTARIIEAGNMLRGRGRSFAGELQQPVLMDELTKI